MYGDEPSLLHAILLTDATGGSGTIGSWEHR